MPSKKVALITGAGKKRVGSHVAEALGNKGYALIIHYRSSGAEAEEQVKSFKKKGIEAIALKADLADEQSVKNLIEKSLNKFGQLDVLVNTAAVWKPKKLEDITADDVRFHFETNTLGTFLCSLHAGLAMVKQSQGGNIILFGDWAEQRPYKNYAAYFPSKGAIPVMTRSLAVELGEKNRNIRVNCILPGPVMLPPDLPKQEKSDAIEATLLKREGSPQNVAQVVLFFIENSFITGVCLPVDGGRTIYAKGL